MKSLFLLLALTLLVALPMRAEAASSHVSFTGDHGKLAGVLTTPDGKDSYPLVVVLHGFTSQKDRPLLIAISDELAARGIASLRFDFNGHGESEGRFQDMTVPNEIVDAKKAIEYAKTLPGVTEVALAGHSQGGVVASMTAGDLKGEISALALLAPAAVLRDDAIRGNTMGALYDPLDPPEYVILKEKFRLGRDYIKTAFDLPIYETAAGYSGPACIIHGNADRVVPYTYGERYAHLYTNSEYHLMAGVDHSFTGVEKEAATLTADFFAKWLK